jgi:hypothetical protein
MPSKIVDLSARSEIIRNEPFGLHFWECTIDEYLAFLKNPRKTLDSMGIKLPKECRVETTIENHDWLSENSRELSRANGTIVCNVGGGNVAIARNIYRIISYAHRDEDIGKFEKTLLHGSDEEERKTRGRSAPAKGRSTAAAARRAGRASPRRRAGP